VLSSLCQFIRGGIASIRWDGGRVWLSASSQLLANVNIMFSMALPGRRFNAFDINGGDNIGAASSWRLQLDFGVSVCNFISHLLAACMAAGTGILQLIAFFFMKDAPSRQPAPAAAAGQ